MNGIIIEQSRTIPIGVSEELSKSKSIKSIRSVRCSELFSIMDTINPKNKIRMAGMKTNQCITFINLAIIFIVNPS